MDIFGKENAKTGPKYYSESFFQNFFFDLKPNSPGPAAPKVWHNESKETEFFSLASYFWYLKTSEKSVSWCPTVQKN